jgi:hypothetical protein
VPTGIVQIGSWSMGNELALCLKYRQIPENYHPSVLLESDLILSSLTLAPFMLLHWLLCVVMFCLFLEYFMVKFFNLTV